MTTPIFLRIHYYFPLFILCQYAKKMLAEYSMIKSSIMDLASLGRQADQSRQPIFLFFLFMLYVYVQPYGL